MRPTPKPSRRDLLAGGSAALGALALGGCNQLDKAGQSPSFREFLSRAEGLTEGAQRGLLRGQPLALEYTDADLSPAFKANGSTDPDTAAYLALVQSKFADWKLEVSGLVNKPLSLSLADLRALPARSQITRHDCVEGWSCIGKWKGPQLGAILDQAGLTDTARYIVFSCADVMEAGLDGSQVYYYESIDLFDAFHPQTILAYDMNDQPLTVAHGAPIRLRVERQLGYKSAKYILKIEAVERFAAYGDGKGGYWEDRGYEWYAGI